MATQYGGTAETDLSYNLGPLFMIGYNVHGIIQAQIRQCVRELQGEEANFPTEFRIRVNDSPPPKKKRRRTQKDPDTTDSESDSDSDSYPDDREDEDEPDYEDPFRGDWLEQGLHDMEEQARQEMGYSNKVRMSDLVVKPLPKGNQNIRNATDIQNKTQLAKIYAKTNLKAKQIAT